jgi:two-component system cell cycle response regulator DivK
MQTILIVDNVTAQRELLAHWLQDDYSIFTAADGAAGIALTERIDPDLIFMTLALPGVDGVEATRQIKAQARRRDIPLIALIAPPLTGDDATARAAGCADALCIPLEEERVAAALQKWLGGG